MKAEVTLINPAPRAKKEKKVMAKKKRKSPKRRRRTNPAPRSNPPRRRRRRAGRAVRRVARRGVARARSMMMIDPKIAMKGDTAYRAMGALAASFAVMKFGGPRPSPASWPTGSGLPASPMMGEALSARGYLMAFLGAYVGGEIAARIWGRAAGEQVYLGGVDLMVQKLVWTQLISRNAWAQQQFGNVHGYATMPGNVGQNLGQMDQAQEGDIYTDEDGNVWLSQGGRWVSMQGLVEAGTLGQLVEAGTLGDTGSGYLPSSTSAQENAWSQYSQTGSSDPYHAAYAR